MGRAPLEAETRIMPTFDYQAFDQSDKLVSGSLFAKTVEEAKGRLVDQFKSVLLISEASAPAETPAPAPPPPKKRRKVVYLFKAIDENDQLIEGSLFAPSLGAACQRLERMYVELVSIREKNARAEEATETTSSPPLASDVVAQAFRSVCLGVANGVGLARALQDFADAHSGELSQVFHRLARSVEAGKPFSLALKEQTGVFDEALVSIIRAGEARGALVHSMESAVRVTEQNFQFRARCARAVAYPLALTSVTLFVLWAFIRFGLPMLAPMVAQSDRGVPFVTRWLLNMSADGLAFHLLSGAFVAISCWLLLSFSLDLLFPEGADYRWGIGLRHLPVVGELMRAEEKVRATRLVASLLEAGVHPSRIPRVGAKSRWVPGLRARFEQADRRYKETLSLGESLLRFQVVPPEAGLLIRFGEETEQVADLARSAVFQVDTELEQRLVTFSKRVGPFFIGAAGLLMVITAVAAFVPMIQLLLEL